MGMTYTLLVTFSVAASAPKGTAPIAPMIEPGKPTIQACLERERELRKQYHPLPYVVSGRCKPEY